jgi:hypothetical protein
MSVEIDIRGGRGGGVGGGVGGLRRSVWQIPQKILNVSRNQASPVVARAVGAHGEGTKKVYSTSRACLNPKHAYRTIVRYRNDTGL